MNSSSDICAVLRNQNCNITVIPKGCKWKVEPDPARDVILDHLDLVTYPILLLISTVGNALSVFILAKERPRTSKCVYLVAVACLDITSMWAQMLPYVISNSEIIGISGPLHPNIGYAEAACIFLYEASGLAASWTLVAFSVNQLLAVRAPEENRAAFQSARRSTVVTIIIIFITGCFFSPPLIEFSWCRPKAANIEEFCKNPPNSSVIRILQQIYIYSAQLTMPILIFLIMLVVNTSLMRILILNRKARQREFEIALQAKSQTAASERSALLMLGACVLLYFICNGPAVMNCVMEILDMACARPVSAEFRYRSRPIILLFLNLNSSLNFILYCIIDPAFRAAVVDTVRPKRS